MFEPLRLRCCKMILSEQFENTVLMILFAVLLYDDQKHRRASSIVLNVVRHELRWGFDLIAS